MFLALVEPDYVYRSPGVSKAERKSTFMLPSALRNDATK